MLDGSSTGQLLQAPEEVFPDTLRKSVDRLDHVFNCVEDDLELLDLSRAFDPDQAAAGGRSAYVRITRGCNKFCSYCLVPFPRGAEVHRPPASSLDECRRLAEKGVRATWGLPGDLVIADISAHEEPTNAGIPTVGVVVRLDNGAKFTAATPLGTSAGTDEAVHLVDSIIEAGPVTRKHPDLFQYNEAEKGYRLRSGITAEAVTAKKDDELSALWIRAKRYGGKGCLNAAVNVEEIIAPRFLGKRISDLESQVHIDRELLQLELELAVKRGKIDRNAPAEARIAVMQRKGNLGMNAILSVSLALGRLLAARDGKELPDVLGELESKIDRGFLYGLDEQEAAGATRTNRAAAETTDRQGRES